MDGDAQSEDPGKNGMGNPKLVALEDPSAVVAPLGTSLMMVLPPTIPTPTVPYGTPPMPGTSTIDTTTGRRWATGANKVRFLSSAQHFPQIPGIQNTKNQD
jgi:hypothetical protein